MDHRRRTCTDRYCGRRNGGSAKRGHDPASRASVNQPARLRFRLLVAGSQLSIKAIIHPLVAQPPSAVFRRRRKEDTAEGGCATISPSRLGVLAVKPCPQ